MMKQIAAVFTRTGAIQLELPSPDEILLSGVRWGCVEAFPTPAYWQCQVIARRLVGRPALYKLGRTLAEEVAACLLGGHGIPAPVGIAAYEKLRKLGAFTGETPSQEQLDAWLREPLQVGQRQVRYRFAAQKARYLAACIPAAKSAPDFITGKQLRDWLTQLPGIGPKTASWIARNWMDADDVAILDIHIMRIGQAMGLFPRGLTVERHYLQLEALFLQFSQALDVRASELDAVVWHEMASSPTTVRVIMDQLRENPVAPSRRQPKKRSSQDQLAFG
jgi:N-glycosylase/DNA lyase